MSFFKRKRFIVPAALVALWGLWAWLYSWQEPGAPFEFKYTGELIQTNGQWFLGIHATSLAKRPLLITSIAKASGLINPEATDASGRWTGVRVVSGYREEVPPKGEFTMMVEVDPDAKFFNLICDVQQEMPSLGIERRWGGIRRSATLFQPPIKRHDR